MEDAQYSNPFRLDSLKNQIIAVERNRPKAPPAFLFTARLFQSHSFLRRVSQLKALRPDGGPDARGSGWVVSRNIVFDLVEVLLGQRREKDGQAAHRCWRRRRRFVAGIRGRGSLRAVWIMRLRSSRLAAAAVASCSSSKRRPARMTSDLLLNRPLATNRSISFSKCGVMTLLMPETYSVGF